MQRERSKGGRSTEFKIAWGWKTGLQNPWTPNHQVVQVRKNSKSPNRAQTDKPQWWQYWVQEGHLGLESGCLQARLTAVQVSVISSLFYKQKTSGPRPNCNGCSWSWGKCWLYFLSPGWLWPVVLVLWSCKSKHGIYVEDAEFFFFFRWLFETAGKYMIKVTTCLSWASSAWRCRACSMIQGVSKV